MKRTNTLPAIGLGTGLWISPAGHVIALPGRHIKEIIAWPDRFGLTPARIESIYRHFGEPMPVEGRARHHIIRAVVFTGWIRLRQQRNYWSVTVDSLDTRRRPLQSFFHARTRPMASADTPRSRSTAFNPNIWSLPICTNSLTASTPPPARPCKPVIQAKQTSYHPTWLQSMPNWPGRKQLKSPTQLT